MAPINRRSFVAAFAGLACAALAMPSVMAAPEPKMVFKNVWPLGECLETHDGADIIGMQSVGDELIVISDTSIYRLRGEDIARIGAIRG